MQLHPLLPVLCKTTITNFKENKMKTVIINGAYHRDGIVATLVEEFIKGERSVYPDATSETISLLDLDIEYCMGCSTCAGTRPGEALGECAARDPMAEVLKKMADCDRLVFATPVYVSGPSARMKKFMERCLPVLAPSSGLPKSRIRPQKTKRGLVIVSSGAPYPVNVWAGITAYPVKSLAKLCRFFGCSRVERIQCGGAESSPRMKTRFMKKAFKTGQRL
jgi:FMN-dependent NADH-azoreductase